MNAEAVEALRRIDIELGEPALDVVLRNGDAPYVPRAYPHFAQTADSHSVHLTLGLHCYVGTDFAWASAQGIRAGEYVPRNLLENAGTRVRARLHYERTFVDSYSVTETLFSPQPSNGVTRIARNCVIVREDEHVVLGFQGGAGRFPRHFERALRATAARSDGASAPELRAEEQREMCTALYQIGFISARDR